MKKFGKWNALFLIIGVVVVMLSLSGCMAPTFFASAPNTIYVTNVSDNTVSVINGQTNNVVATIPTENSPQEVGVNIVTGMIYVTNNSSNSVSVINGQTNNVTAIISVGNGPVGIEVNPTTDMIYVVNSQDNTVSVINGQTNNVVYYTCWKSAI